jgi:hypothetical protein
MPPKKETPAQRLSAKKRIRELEGCLMPTRPDLAQEAKKLAEAAYDDDMPAAALASEIGKLVRSVESETQGETAATFPGLHAVWAAIGDLKTLKVQLD